jgi:four helix bundle protein
MPKIECFEELQSWQKGRQLANLIYELSMHEAFARDFCLRDQIQDAAGSVMHNIAEGFDAGSKPEFVRFLKISRRSASEVQSELYLALDRGYVSAEDMRTAYDLASETKRLINGMIAYLHRSSA